MTSRLSNFAFSIVIGVHIFKNNGIAIVAVRLQGCKLVHDTQRGLDGRGINHVEDRETRKTTENNAIALTTLKQTETNRETGSQVQGAGQSCFQGEPATSSRANFARDDVLESKSRS